MSSSISSSEAQDTSGQTAWRRWIAIYFAGLIGTAGILFALVVLADPYSTGRFTPLTSIDIASSARTFANAGRIRDPSFDSILAGDSTATRIEPDKLNALTGRRYLQLSIPGLGPGDSLKLVRAFAREHPKNARTLVFTLSSLWCETDENRVHRYPNFPGWLYESDDTQYLRNILSLDAIQAAFHRLAIRAGVAREPGRRDGYVPREGRGVWTPQRVANLATATRPSQKTEADTFPALARLEEFVGSLASQTEVILLWMPYHISQLPMPNSAAAAWLDRCKARATAIAKAKPATTVIDRMREDDTTRDPNNFWDGTHARDHVMRALEKDIASALRR